MPEYCCVPHCKQKNGGHTFPKDGKLRLAWRVAIKRIDPETKKLWEPSPASIVCKNHFHSEDYKDSLLGERPRLKTGAVPSIFSFSSTKVSRKQPRERGLHPTEPIIEAGIDVQEVLIESTNDNTTTSVCDKEDASIQCELLTSPSSSSQLPVVFCIEHFQTDDKAIQYYTGFDDFNHFIMFFNVLGPAVDHLNYQCSSLSIVNHLFLTLMKLRQGKDDVELAILFNINEQTVSKVFNTWINFMFFQLKEIDIWPSKDIVDETMPTDFKAVFPNTRVILDATETPIQKPSNVNNQMASFSSYKHRNTLKTMIGITPRGVVSYISDSYGGSASDRQIIERSELLSKEGLFDSNDSIMADKGILVQDLFCSKDVHVNTPTVLKGKSQLEPSEVVHDRRVASKRIHIERVIGLSKTYKILKRELIHSKLQLGSRIVFVCFSLANFRNCIVGRYA